MPDEEPERTVALVAFGLRRSQSAWWE